MTRLNKALASLFLQPHFAPLRRLQFIVAVGIFAYAALDRQPLLISTLATDKTLHFIGNLLLIGSTWTAFYGRINHRIAIAFALCYSMLMETLQSLTQTRQPDIIDGLTNLVGLLVGYGMCLLLERHLRRLHRKEVVSENITNPEGSD